MRLLDTSFGCEHEHTSGMETNSSEERAWRQK